MTAKIINGKELSQQIRNRLKATIANFTKKPNLAVVLVGNDEASLIYDRNKKKAAEEIGMECNIYHLDKDIAEAEVVELVESLNNDANVNGIIVQMPLPPHLNADKILQHIAPFKDVDGFGVYNLGLLQMNSENAIIAATPKGILYMLQTVCPNLSGKHAVIIGRSTIVGKPLAALLTNQDCTVTLTHSKTENIAALTKQADIVIAACGRPEMVKKDWIKDGAIVIDVGINRLNQKLVGDVDFEGVQEVAAYITPVPGGVGPMTIAMLLDNTFAAYLKQSSN